MFAKAQFVNALCNRLPELFPTKSRAEKAFDALCDIMSEAIRDGGQVRLPDIGSFLVTDRAPRTGRNPKTGERIAIPARKAVRFNPARTLSEAVSE